MNAGCSSAANAGGYVFNKPQHPILHTAGQNTGRTVRNVIFIVNLMLVSDCRDVVRIAYGKALSGVSMFQCPHACQCLHA